MKTLFKIIGLIVLAITIIALLGMYKFNYLANQPGYDVDGNKIKMDASWDMDGDGINDCEKEGTCDHTADYTQPKPQVEQDYVGLTIEDAQVLAELNKVPFRVVMQDGQSLPVTLDYRPGRINATTENGVVTSYEIEGQEEVVQYNANSWEESIPSTCLSFYDGCNNCKREAGSDIAACTKRACFAYDQPKCLDENQPNPDELMVAPMNGEKVSYECDDENKFTISYDEHVSGDAIFALQEDQVMMSDTQERQAYLLTRVESASGEKYTDDSGRIFWNKGEEAVVMQGEDLLYEGCVGQ